jgi:hypothetical protein
MEPLEAIGKLVIQLSASQLLQLLNLESILLYCLNVVVFKPAY